MNVKSLGEEKVQLQTQNENLQVENIDLRAKFEELFTELSLKEAQWCEKEEQLNLKVRLTQLALFDEIMTLARILSFDTSKCEGLKNKFRRIKSNIKMKTKKWD